VTLKVALTLAAGATGSAKLFDVSAVPATTDLHPSPGAEILSVTFAAGAPVLLVNVTVTFCEDPGAKVCSPGGSLIADAGATASAGTS